MEDIPGLFATDDEDERKIDEVNDGSHGDGKPKDLKKSLSTKKQGLITRAFSYVLDFFKCSSI